MMTLQALSAKLKDLARKTILIVEDDYLVALQFENALTEAGYEVVDIASTAAEAVQLVPDHERSKRNLPAGPCLA